MLDSIHIDEFFRCVSDVLIALASVLSLWREIRTSNFKVCKRR